MVKVLLDKYPMGSVKGQKSDGRYIDGYLYSTLKDLADVIVNDMTFLGVVFSSTLEVGTGKSVIATQIEEVWCELMKQKHGIDVPMSTNNIVWRPKELIERAFNVPKYSPLLLDEWEDASYWSELGMTLRQFFRKCRQLNLFIMIIIPNFFQLPLQYAVSRSVFAIDVRFEGKFQRGFFSFYGFEAKKKLYILGKKTHNYYAARPDFIGRFTDGYGVPEEEYRIAKAKDLRSQTPDEVKEVREIDIKAKYFREMHRKFPEIHIEKLADAFGWKKSAAYRHLSEENTKENPTSILLAPNSPHYNKNLNIKEVNWNEEELPLEAT